MEKIKVNYYNEDVMIESKYISWPQSYEDLIEDIIQNFQLTNNNIKIDLKLITVDNDIINIYSQDNLGFISDNKIKEFKFSIVDNKYSGDGKTDINFQELNKLLEPNLFKEEEDFNIDNIMKDIFDLDRYKQKKNEEGVKLFNTFKKNFEKNIEDLFSQKSKIMEEEINKKLLYYHKLFYKEQKEAYNVILDVKDYLLVIRDIILEMSEAQNVKYGIKDIKKNEQAKHIYKELNFYKYNSDFDEDQIIALIKEENFNKENVQKWINEKIAEKIYDIISKLDEVDITKNEPKEVKEKIIELNFNIDKIKESFKKILIEDNSCINPGLNPDNDDIDDDNKNHYIYGYDDEEEEANKFFEEIEDEYGIYCGNFDDSVKEKFLEIIIKLNLNRDQIFDAIESLLNGENYI